MVTRFATSPPTDNCPQPKEAQPLSPLDIRLIQHFDSSALWFDGPEVAINWPFPHPMYPVPYPKLRFATFASLYAAAKTLHCAMLTRAGGGGCGRLQRVGSGGGGGGASSSSARARSATSSVATESASISFRRRPTSVRSRDLKVTIRNCLRRTRAAANTVSCRQQECPASAQHRERSEGPPAANRALSGVAVAGLQRCTSCES
jgi:hypothetical protein